jgi:DNA repair exonuclease SbcCD ATPase subunit
MFGIPFIEVENFRSFAGTHSWVLGEGPGLFYLTGVNYENKRLSSNGCGKSSLLDAICWCLYGRTTRLLRGNDVVNYGASGCRVRVDLRLRGQLETIVTTQHPNSVTLNGHVIERQALITHLGLNFESFLYAVIIPQFGDSFLDLSPAAKLGLFSDIMELDYWLDKSKEASKAAEAVELSIRNATNRLLVLNTKKENLIETIKELTERSKKFNDEQAARHKQFQIDLSAATKVVSAKYDEIEKMAKDLDADDGNIKDLDRMLKAEQAKAKAFDEELQEAKREISILAFKLTNAEVELETLKSVGAVCSVCKQPVDKHHMKKEQAKFEALIKQVTAEVSEFEQVKNAISDDESKANLIVKELTRELSVLNLNRFKLERSYDNACTELKYKEHDMNKMVKLMRENTAQDNEFMQAIAVKNQDLSKLTSDIAKTETEIADLNEQYAAVSYWVSGFRQIRLNIVEETLRNLEVEVNNNLESMGMTDWTVEFDVERENKSGGITKGFTTLIHDHKGRTVRYEAISGGEGQRVRLAGCFGLANLIMERAGLISKTEFYDELSQHMSTEGIEDMLNTLRDRAINYGRQIWVVDHHSISYADFSGTTVVVKDVETSRIQAG